MKITYFLDKTTNRVEKYLDASELEGNRVETKITWMPQDVARQDPCCGRTRCVLWQDKIPVAAAPLCGSLMSCHNRGVVLPQQRSCLATAEILSCHNTHLVLPQQGSCLATVSNKGGYENKGKVCRLSKVFVRPMVLAKNTLDPVFDAQKLHWN